MSPRIGVIEHDLYCPPGLLGQWLVEAGAVLDVRRPYAGDPLPALAGPGDPGDPDETDAVDGLVVLGGPMDAWDDDHHAWLDPTRELIREAGRRAVPTLGVCLGHQMCALALGGRVGRSPRGQQTGMTPIGWQEEAMDDRLLGALAQRIEPSRGVQWNDDLVLALPPEAVVLAQTPAGDLQSARFADTVWGVQWHPEVDETLVAPWAEKDEARHAARGLDQAALLRQIADSRAELEATWRPLADAFVALLVPVAVR